MLYIFTLITNLIALAIAVWLGLYIVTHSPRSAIAWLTGLTLLSVASYFYNFLLALDPPLSSTLLPLWMQPFLLLWPQGAFEHGWGNWLKGWQIMPAIMIWHHITLLLRPEGMNNWRWVRVIAGYTVALIGIIYLRNTSLFFSSEKMEGDVLTLTTLAPGSLYPLFMGSMFLFVIFSIINLLRSVQVSQTRLQKKQLVLMTTATIAAGLTVPIGALALRFNFPLPRVVLTLLLSSAIFMMGYGVARYSAFIEGRAIVRDFFYNLVAMLVLAGLYFIVAWSSFIAYDVPIAIVATLMVVAIFTHSLTNVARQFFDLLFYRSKSRKLREKLRSLVYKAYQLESLEEYLSEALEALCNLIGATYGVIFLFKKEGLETVATYRWIKTVLTLSPKDLESDDVRNVPLGKLPAPFEEAVLLIPLYAAEKQIGVLILGRPENSNSFALSDVEQALDASDRFADAIRDADRENEQLLRLVKEAEKQSAKPDLATNSQTNTVEDALRNLFNYAYLADTPLAETKLVNEKITEGKSTHIERGKAVQTVIIEAIEKMKPNTEVLHEPFPREWYPYIILHEAYTKEVQNRDIMSKLYISEGTFNRTRRAAIRSLARALQEMEDTN
jgi:hypothetical protein